MKTFREYTLGILIWSGIFYWLNEIWKYLEILFDGGIQPSVSDSIISVILVTIIYVLIDKWIEIK